MWRKLFPCSRPPHHVEDRDTKGEPRCRSCGASLDPERQMSPSSSQFQGYCTDCIDKHGHTMSYEDVFERLVVKEYMGKLGMDRATAETAARERMSGLPEWVEAQRGV